MRILEPEVKLIEQEDIKEHVCKCARVCYGKESGNDDRLYANLLKMKHNSMFRHASYYAIIQNFNPYACEQMMTEYANCPYIDYHYNRSHRTLYIATNGNFMIDHENSPIHELISHNLVSSKEFSNASEYSWRLMRYTFAITTQISTSRELNRTSPNNIAEKSSRYVDLSEGVICRPHWLSKKDADAFNANDIDVIDADAWRYLQCCKDAFSTYSFLINHGFKREDARGVLPLDTATQVIYTYSIKEWNHIIELRADKRAHKNCQIIANMVKRELEELGY